MYKMKVTFPFGTTDFTVALPVLNFSSPSHRLKVAEQEFDFYWDEVKLSMARANAALDRLKKLRAEINLTKGGQQ